MDFILLREIRKYKEEICKRVGDLMFFYEVDVYNVVFVWEALFKLEYSVKILRGKINKLFSVYLIDFLVF